MHVPPAVLYLPSGQPIPLHCDGLYGVVPLPLLYFPKGQSMHADSPLVVAPGGLYSLSTAQDVPVQSPLPLSPWNVPPGQLLQVVCASSVAPTVPNFPAGHTISASHVPAGPVPNVVQQLSNPLEGEYLPDGQVTHMPLGLLNFPGGHPDPPQPS